MQRVTIAHTVTNPGHFVRKTSRSAQNVPLCAVAARGLGPGLLEPFEPVTAVRP